MLDRSTLTGGTNVRRVERVRPDFYERDSYRGRQLNRPFQIKGRRRVWITRMKSA
jgi:hypothetical protein